MSETYENNPVAELVERSVRRGEGALAAGGALTAETGAYTGRSPRDKFIVDEPAARDHVAWGPVNQALPPGKFQRLYSRFMEYVGGRDLFTFDGYVGADQRYRLAVRVQSEFAWHGLFAHNLFIRPTAEELRTHTPEFTVIDAPHFHADPRTDGTNSEAFIIVSFEKRLVMIGGTHYAGEIKKSIFGVMNYLMPERDVFPMHCSANVGIRGDVALFFGLSGTGKTTLSADPERRLIGDDEHGWSSRGVFNFEGGCYAKTIRLSRGNEPQIWNAIRFGSVLENVVLDPRTRRADYDDASRTENTRVAYPLDYIDGAVIPSVGGHPQNILFLTADAFGVLPPIAKLDREQAIYYFLSGYTSKLAGTERGVTEPEATFSAAFGEPFLPLPATRYADMLGDRLDQHRSNVFLVNTGWSGGPYGVGERIPLRYTRAMVQAALSGDLDRRSFAPDPAFGLRVPDVCPGVPSDMLQPRRTWDDAAAYDSRAANLAARFAENFEKFADAARSVMAAGPRVNV